MLMFKCQHLLELEDELRRRGKLRAETTIFSHQLLGLLELTQASERLRKNEALWRLFNTVNRWVPAWRYSADLSRRENAEEFLDSIEKIAYWIENNV
jgi:hypothetical protein